LVMLVGPNSKRWVSSPSPNLKGLSKSSSNQNLSFNGAVTCQFAFTAKSSNLKESRWLRLTSWQSTKNMDELIPAPDEIGGMDEVRGTSTDAT
jgi:hypothetical protein